MGDAQETVEESLRGLSAPRTILIVDDDGRFLDAMEAVLGKEFAFRRARSFQEAVESLAPLPDLILLDLRLGTEASNRDGLRVLDVVRRVAAGIPVVMMTAYGDVEVAVECMQRGAFDFLRKGAPLPEVRARLRKALDHGALSRRVRELESEIRLIEPREMVGVSASMERLRRAIQLLGRDGEATVLIRGETGTGKELVARAIHTSGRRQGGPFVPVLLSTFARSLLESELFGHEAGAFTDARTRHSGCIERAAGGVLFLDEIGDVDLATQVKLLRVVEEKVVMRLGGTKPVPVDVQIVAATNADLEARVAAGLFREDLYFRLRVHELSVPPLRQRRDDIPLLAEHFLVLLRQRGKNVPPVSMRALRAIERFDWPGNVRHLRNAIEAMVFRAEIAGADEIREEHLPTEVFPAQEIRERPAPGSPSMRRSLAQTELARIEAALVASGGRKANIWQGLGYSNRFALSRRVHAALRSHPDLRDEFPAAGRAYGSRSSREYPTERRKGRT